MKWLQIKLSYVCVTYIVIHISQILESLQFNVMVELQKVKVSTVAKKQMAEKSLKTEYYLPPPPIPINLCIPASISAII